MNKNQAPTTLKALTLGALALVILLSTSQVSADQTTRPFGDIETFVSIPALPGFPEGISVDGNLVYVSGPATAGTAETGPSKVFVYKTNNANLKEEIVISGENLAFEHALSCNAVDGDGRLYVLTAQLFAPPFAQTGILRFTKHGDGYIQETYSDPFPNLPTCHFGPIPVSCALPNDIAFDDDGNAYVTDSFQSTIWRVPPGGGAPEVWLQSSFLAGSGALPIGVNGIRLDPESQFVYFSVTFSVGDPSVGAIMRIPLVNDPDETDIELFHVYDLAEGPDGLAFGASGNLYVALAASNEISVLAPDGTEIARIASDPSDEIPLDAPANIAFDDASRSLLVTNHASLSGNEANFAVLNVFVDDTADPLAQPILP